MYSKLADLEPCLISLSALYNIKSTSTNSEVEVAFGGTDHIKMIVDCIKIGKQIEINHDLDLTGMATVYGKVISYEQRLSVFTSGPLNGITQVIISYKFSGNAKTFVLMLNSSYQVTGWA